MGAFLARRAAMLVAALLVSSFVIFGSLDLAPGDPLSTLTGGRTLPPEAVAALRAQYHLDDPFLVRYAALARQRGAARRPRDVDRVPRAASPR